MSLSRTREFPVRTALSGPAAGVVGAASVGVRAERPDLITLDVGGTSADVALIRGGTADIRFDRDVAGFPIRLPMVDIHTIGAGGGSIAWFDQDDLLKVGPISAGADPGPACYGLGGTEATVSDANLVLGRLSPQLADGALRLDGALAAAAIEPLAGRLELSLFETAHGVLKIMVANMVRALRTISVERGYDPRSFCLMPFGGAGPLHAREVAQELGIREILIPPAPGIICAEGLIVSDLKEDFVEGAHAVVEEGGLARVEQSTVSLREAALEWIEREKVDPAEARFEVQADVRFVGQNFELRIPLMNESAGQSVEVPTADDLRSRFTEAHELAYGFASQTDPIEVVNVRLTARARLMEIPRFELDVRDATPLTERGRRDVVFDSRKAAVDTPTYLRSDLMAGDVLVGPAIIEQLDTTIPHYPGDIIKVLESGALLVETTDERF
jgi:N-methylhydantoinase A